MSAPPFPDPLWWREAVFYQVCPRSFQDSDGDGVGDLEGLRRRLPYVKALGVDAVWLSPVFASPMRDFGYDVSDYEAIDPLFGDLADFDRLVTEVHALGLRIIIDQVYSHTSSDHPWFRESRADRTNAKADWYVWADPKPDGSPPNNWLAAFGGVAWEWEPRRRQYHLHNFLASQPDLDVSRPAVQDALLEVARFWFARGVDGFRLDVANCYVCDPALRDNPPSGRSGAVNPFFLQAHVHDRDQEASFVFAGRLRRLADEIPGRVLLAELASDDPEGAIAAYTRGSERYHTAYAFRFLSRPFGAEVVRQGIEALRARAPDAWPSYAFSNHDFERVASRWGEGRGPEFPKTLMALLTTLPGTPFIYQGEELGLPQADVPFEALKDPNGLAFWPGDKGRDGCRTPMPWTADPLADFTQGRPWLPIDPRHRARAVSVQEADPGSMLRFTRDWLARRRASPALRRGDFRFLDLAPPLLGYERRAAGEAVRLVFNFGEIVAEIGAEERLRLAAGVGAVRAGETLRLSPGGFALLLAAAPSGDADP